jgi:hypothetical protein
VYNSSLPVSPLKYGWPVAAVGLPAVFPNGIPLELDDLIAII